MVAQENGTETHVCPDCGAVGVKLKNNDPLVEDRTNFQCTNEQCGGTFIVYK